jgi:arsenate reductase
VSLPREGLVLLHNPRCSKSRQTKALLEERGVDFTERRYLDEPLSPDELRELAARLGKPPGEWVRRKESAFAEAGLDADSDDDALLDAIARHPILMERPILVGPDAARIGRPPEDVLALVD